MRKWVGVIIDDQQWAIDALLDLLADVEYVEIIATFVEEKSAKRFLHANPVDFMILDVELQNTTAFQFLTGLSNPRIPTILYTAFEAYEDEGYDRAMVDVLLKPVSKSRLLGALRRVDSELKRLLPPIEDDLDGHYDYFQVKGPLRYGRQIVWLKNIVYADMQNGKPCIHLADGSVLESNTSFADVLEKLPKKWFQQCSHNIVFNINFYKGYASGKVILTMLKKRRQRDIPGTPDEQPYVTLPTGSKEAYADFYNFLNSNLL